MATAKQNDNKPKKTRNFVGLWYPEDETHVAALEHLKNNYRCAYILHDKDCDEDGVIKKAHWHVVFTIGNAASPRFPGGVAKELGIAENYVQGCGNLDGALRYLVHYDDPDKYQYEVDEVQGDMVVKLKEALSKGNESEGERVKVLLDHIAGSKYLTVTEFANWCAVNGYWDAFRRSSVVFIKIIEEHNKEVASQPSGVKTA